MPPEEPQPASVNTAASIAARVIIPDRRELMSLLRRILGFVFRLAC